MTKHTEVLSFASAGLISPRAQARREQVNSELLAALVEMESIASEYAFEGAGMVQGPDNPPESIRQAIITARYVIEQAKGKV